LGQYLQDFTPVHVLKILVGVLTIAVALWQIWNIYQNNYGSKKKNIDEAEETLQIGQINAAFTQSDEDDKSKEKPSIFFLVGCQRSGSNWLHLLISNRYPDIATPHPPHILKNFMPILDEFGDLTKENNFSNLVFAVCDFVEANPVPWMDKNKSIIIFNRQLIIERCIHKPSLVSIFEEVMNIFAEANECQTWMCKSMMVGKFHDLLLEHFGSRLKYIYLYRDPRDVCQSFKKAPVGNSHLYVISKMWSKLQQVALNLVKIAPEKVYTISYEALLKDKEKQLDKLAPFITGGLPDEDLQSHEENYNSESSNEARLRAGKSKLWQNLTRGDSFRKEQLCKWRQTDDMTETDISHVEAGCYDEMLELGYVPVAQKKIDYRSVEIIQFEKENEEGNKRRKEQLKEEDNDDWERREKQEAVFRKFSKTSKDLATIENGAFDNKNTKSEILRNFSMKFLGQLWPVRPVIFWMVAAGFLSGFLGGIIGVRGPPLIIFFFIFEYPKVEVKANGTVIATVNLLIRIFTYMFKPPPEAYASDSWFVKEDTWLYLAVAVAGLLASPIGIFISRYLNKPHLYKAALAALLIVNGITMITVAII
jgi:uncharacterized membrane protein YfcA